MRFLNAKIIRPAEIHIYMIAMNDGDVNEELMSVVQRRQD